MFDIESCHALVLHHMSLESHLKMAAVELIKLCGLIILVTVLLDLPAARLDYNTRIWWVLSSKREKQLKWLEQVSVTSSKAKSKHLSRVVSCRRAPGSGCGDEEGVHC